MAFDAERDFDVKHLFTTLKQTNYATVRIDGDLTNYVFANALSFAQQPHRVHSDKGHFGKGHGLPTALRTLTKDLQLGRAFDASSLVVGQAAAFTLGACATAGTPPNLTHTITTADLSSSKDAPVTTIYEEEGSGSQRKVHSAAFMDYALSFNSVDPVQLSFNLVGSGEVTVGAIAMPAVTPVTFFDSGSTQIKLGPQGATVDISERVVEGSITVNANLQVDLGRHPNSGLYLKRIWFHEWSFGLSLRIFDNGSTDMYDLFNDKTIQEAEIINQFDVQHEAAHLFPAIVFTEWERTVENGKVVHNLSTGEDGVLLDAGGTPNEPLQVTVKNNIASYLATS